MTQYQDDDFSKAYTTALYRTKGTVTTNVQVKSDENLEIDLLFIANLANPAWETEDLGLFDRLMTVHPTIAVEHYSGYLRPEHFSRCVSRMDFYVAGETKAATKRGDRLKIGQKPFTWMIATACSRKMLRSFGAVPDKALGPGVYRISSGWRIGLVIVRELPETLETLWLRGLGKDKILSEAFTGIRSLPETKRERNDIVEVCIKHFKYLVEKSVTDLSEEEGNFMKTMQEIDILYQAEMSRVRSEGLQEGQKEGRQEGRQEQGAAMSLRLLNRRVGPIAIDLQEKVKALPLEQLDLLGEDLLDFSGLEDLVGWLERNKV
jgi:Domain of unknown function (DUF4351)